MSNDTLLNLATVAGGDKLRDYDDGSRKWPVGFIAFGDVSGTPIATPTIVSATQALPVTLGSSTSTVSVANFPATQTVSVANQPASAVGAIGSATPSNGTLLALDTYHALQPWSGVRLADGSVAAEVVVTNERPLVVAVEPSETPSLVKGIGDRGEVLTIPSLAVPTNNPLWAVNTPAPLAVDNYGQVYSTTRGRRAHYILSAFPGLATAGRILWLNAGARIVRLLAFTCTAFTAANSSSPVEMVLESWSTPQSGGTTIGSNLGKPVDPVDPTGTATVTDYSSPPTIGTLSAQLRGDFLFPSSNVTPGTAIKWDFRNSDSKYPTLYDSNHAFDVLFVSIPTNTTFAFTWEWLEE